MLTFNHHETHYTKKVVEWIKKHKKGWFVFRVEGITTMNGVPDILGWDDTGRAIAIEVKKEKGRLSKAQSHFLNTVPFGIIARVHKNISTNQIICRLFNAKESCLNVEFSLGKER